MTGEAWISESGFNDLESGLAGTLKHLYSLGACAGGPISEEEEQWGWIFLLAQDLKAHVPGVVGESTVSPLMIQGQSQTFAWGKVPGAFRTNGESTVNLDEGGRQARTHRGKLHSDHT